MLERAEHYKKNRGTRSWPSSSCSQLPLPPLRDRRSAIEPRKCGNGRVAAFVSAPGSAWTLASGDEIKSHFPDAVICALEPKECSTLFNNGRGTHRIEGIGDKMVTLIHNVLTTDFVMVIHDDDCVVGLELVERMAQTGMTNLPGMPHLRGVFGVSGICNILGAIRLARHLQLGPEDNVVTVATDGFDRYPSVLADLRRAARAGSAFRGVPRRRPGGHPGRAPA